MSDFSDDVVLRAIREGDPNGLTIVYKEYREAFISWCVKSYSCSTDEAKDIYQNTIVILYENTRSGKFNATRASVKTYLFAIGKNMARDLLRRSKRWVSFNYTDQEPVPDEFSGFPEDDMDVVRMALSDLGDPCKQLLELHFFQCEGMEEIARIMGYKNSGSAKNQKYKCLLRLRTLVQERRQNQ